MAAANLVASDVDLRSFDCDNVEHEAMRWHMHSTHLPLASQTQFVERGVKETKCVSATDPSEEHRTCMAIVRSHTPLGRFKFDDETSYNSSKIQSMTLSAQARASQHNLWRLNQEDNQCDARFNQIWHCLTQGHFKSERIDAKEARVDDTGGKFKKPNVAQQMKPQTKMPETSGLVPCGKLVQSRNMNDLRIELLFRGVKEGDMPLLVTDC